jgi:hypothetical protein
VLIRLELAGPGVQYIAGAPSNLFFKPGERNPSHYSQRGLNQLTYRTSNEERDTANRKNDGTVACQ